MPHSGGFSGGVAFAGRGAWQRSEINLVKGSAKAQKGMIEMELMEAIKGRRSVRKFKPDPIPKEDIEEIIQAGLCAPSAQNLQPWYFVALTKKEDLSYLFAELGTTAFSHRKELEARFKNNPEVVEETMEFMSAMGGSQTIILGFLNKPNYSDEILPSCIESVAAAMENMCLAAYDKGIATCWVEAVVRAGNALGSHFATDHGKLVGAIVLGYADMEPRPIKQKGARYVIR